MTAATSPAYVNGNGKGNGIEPLVCRNCGCTFDPADKSRRKPYSKADDGTFRCRDQRSCRSRKLASDLKIDLFVRYPRELLITLMDRRPPNWKESGWKSVFPPEQRVGASIIYFSWCFPVSMPYACQTFTNEEGDEDILRDRYGEPMRHTHRTLAAFLNMPHQQVTAAINWRERRKLLREEDARIYPEPKPQALTIDERFGICTDASESNLKELSVISPKFRPVVANLLQEAQGKDLGIWTDARERVQGIGTRFNLGLAGIRTARDQDSREFCTWLANILGRPAESERKERACVVAVSSNGHARTPQSPPINGEVHGGYQPAVKTGPHAEAQILYKTIPEWQDRYPGTEFSRQRFSLGKADRQLVLKILESLGGEPVSEFVLYMEREIFPQRPPTTYGLPLLVNFAGDFHRRKAKEAWAPVNPDLLPYAERYRLEMEKVLADPGAPERDKELAREVLSAAR